MHRLGYLSVLAVVLLAPAAKSMARPPDQVIQVGAIRLSQGILVSRLDVSATCQLGADDAPTCALHAAYVLVNPGAAPIDGAGALPVHEQARDVKLLLDGAPTTAASSEAVSALAPTQPAPFALAIPPNGARTLTLDATLTGTRTTGRLGLMPSPVHARHVLLHTPSLRRAIDLIIEAPVASTRVFGYVGTAKLRVPEGWDLGAAKTWTLDANGIPTDTSGGMHTTLRVPQFPVRNGGALLGLGGAFGDTGGFRLRLGWEIAAPSWLLYQVSAETNLRGAWTVTPLVLAASTPIVIIPSFGLGLGLPIVVRPETRVGVRLQLEAQILPVGFVASCDFWPAKSGAPGYTQWTLLGQIAL